MSKHSHTATSINFVNGGKYGHTPDSANYWEDVSHAYKKVSDIDGPSKCIWMP